MKILYFTQFYHPELTAGAFRAYDNALYWSQNGASVTVFTGFPNYPAGKIYDGYHVRLLQEECEGNVHIIRSKISIKQNKTLFNRILNMSSFFFWGIVNIILNGKKIGRDFDVVLGSSGPVFAALLAWLYAALHRIPFVFEIRDITYRQLIATGKSSSGFSVKLMKKFELFFCRRARHVVVVTNGFKEVLSSDGIDKNKISVIKNGVKILPYTERKVSRDGIKLSYFGTLGISQRVEETFPYAAEMAKNQDGFTYQVIGEGAQRAAIEAMLAKGNYPYIQLLHGMMPKELEFYYGKTNLSVVKLTKSEDFKYTLPSKLFQIMGHGIAVLFIGPEGEAAEIICEYDAGIVLSGTLQEDLQVLRDFFGQPDYQEQLNQMGRNGYEAVCRYYDRKVLAMDYLDLLEACSKQRKRKGKAKK